MVNTIYTIARKVSEYVGMRACGHVAEALFFILILRLSSSPFLRFFFVFISPSWLPLFSVSGFSFARL
jgi:hypothetical protein